MWLQLHVYFSLNFFFLLPKHKKHTDGARMTFMCARNETDFFVKLPHLTIAIEPAEHSASPNGCHNVALLDTLSSVFGIIIFGMPYFCNRLVSYAETE